MGDLIFWLFMLGAFIAVIVFVVKFFGKAIKEDEARRADFANKLKNDPAYRAEAKLHKKLDELTLSGGGGFYNTRRYSYLSFEECLEKNIEGCVDYLKDGALMVCTHNLVSPWSDVSNGAAIYAYAPHSAFRKEIKSFEYGGHESFNVLPANSGFGIKKYFGVSDITVTNKKSSVTGSAIAGGILAGGVGAVVGAVHALDKNASGGTDKVNVSGSNFYGVSLYSNRIDYIVVSKKVIDKVKAPDEKYVLKMTDQYCVIHQGLASPNQNELKEITDYLNSVVSAIATWNTKK